MNSYILTAASKQQDFTLDSLQSNRLFVCHTSSSVPTAAVLSPNTPSVNLSVCHILLQKCLQLRT